MHLGQRIFTESLFCLKHCAKNKESLQLPRQGCFRPECRAQTYWLFTASVHSECPMSLQYQCVRYSECSPYTTYKECPSIFRCIVHVPFLEALPLHLCGKFLDEKKVWICFTFFLKHASEEGQFPFCESFMNWRTLRKSNLENMWQTQAKQSICLVPMPIQRRLANEKKKEEVV